MSDLKRCPRCGEPGGLINCSKCHTSRVAGVTWNADKELWSAQVKLNGYAQHVGYYADPEVAAEAILVRSAHAHRLMDAGGYDLEQDQRWDTVAGSDYVPDESFLPTRTDSPGDAPGAADRGVTPPQVVGADPRAGHPSS